VTVLVQPLVLPQKTTIKPGPGCPAASDAD
jgi:hypothetical protein